MKATWNGEVIAEGDETVVVEGNHYFPAESVRGEYLVTSDKPPCARGRARRATTRCA